jgi:hypothetical protein
VALPFSLVSIFFHRIYQSITTAYAALQILVLRPSRRKVCSLSQLTNVPNKAKMMFIMVDVS